MPSRVGKLQGVRRGLGGKGQDRAGFRHTAQPGPVSRFVHDQCCNSWSSTSPRLHLPPGLTRGRSRGRRRRGASTPRRAVAGRPRGQVLEWTSAEGKPYWYRLPKNLDRAAAAGTRPHAPRHRPQVGLGVLELSDRDRRVPRERHRRRARGHDARRRGHVQLHAGEAGPRSHRGLIAYFKKKLPIGKVYLYGHSQGAFFAYWFAGEHPELVDGIVAHAGNVLADVKHPKAAKEKVAIGILHGRADAVVPVDAPTRPRRSTRSRGTRSCKLMRGRRAERADGALAASEAGRRDARLARPGLGGLAPAQRSRSRSTRSRSAGPRRRRVVAAAATAERLLKTAKADEKAALAEKHLEVAALVSELASRHAAALSAAGPTAARRTRRTARGRRTSARRRGPWAGSAPGNHR